MKDLSHHRIHVQRKVLQEKNPAPNPASRGPQRFREAHDDAFWQVTGKGPNKEFLEEREQVRASRKPLRKKHRGHLEY